VELGSPRQSEGVFGAGAGPSAGAGTGPRAGSRSAPKVEAGADVGIGVGTGARAHWMGREARARKKGVNQKEYKQVCQQAISRGRNLEAIASSRKLIMRQTKTVDPMNKSLTRKPGGLPILS
jgi:hypothetical protein